MDKHTVYAEYCARIPTGTNEEVERHRLIESQNKVVARLPVNHPSGFDALAEAVQDLLIYWIQHTITDAKGRYRESSYSSYGIKHCFERDTGIYITNGQFKGAMLALGRVPNNEDDVNWRWDIRPMIRHGGADTMYRIVPDQQFTALLNAALAEQASGEQAAPEAGIS